jgi:putative aldouronate transport system permease protein
MSDTNVQAIATVTPVTKSMRFRIYMKNNYLLYLFLLPPLVYYVLFRYGPIYGILAAFKDYNIFQGVFKSPWNNFASFKQIFGMETFWYTVRNTFLLNALDLVLGFPAPILLSIVLSEVAVKWLKKISQTILYLPHFLSWVIIGTISLQLFSPYTGLLNTVAANLGASEPIPFLTDPYVWLFTYALLGIWQSVGWNSIIYLAAIAGINQELYEAAIVDGAGRLRKIWHITLPGIKPTIIILLIMQVGRMLSIGFDRPYIIGNPMVKEFAEVISTYVYRIGLQSFQFSIATAVGLFQSVVGLIFLLATNYIASRVGEQGIW